MSFISRSLKIIFVLAFFFQAIGIALAGLDTNRLAESDIKEVKNLIVRLTPLIQEREKKQNLSTLTFAELYAPLKKEEKVFLKIDDEKIKSIPEQDVDRTSAEGKASSVQFIHFEFTDEQVKKFKNSSNEIIIGVDHKMYTHTVKLTENNKKALALDFD